MSAFPRVEISTQISEEKKEIIRDITPELEAWFQTCFPLQVLDTGNTFSIWNRFRLACYGARTARNEIIDYSRRVRAGTPEDLI